MKKVIKGWVEKNNKGRFLKFENHVLTLDDYETPLKTKAALKEILEDDFKDNAPFRRCTITIEIEES